MEIITRKKTCEGSSSNRRSSTTKGLMDVVFSWSIRDILMNKNLYRNKVKTIPDTFSSLSGYMNSFTMPLIEETRANLCSGLETLSQSPSCMISSLSRNNFCNSKDLYYQISTKKITGFKDRNGAYEPEVGDLVAVTDIRPRCIEDLNRRESCTMALVQNNSSAKILILASQPICSQDLYHRNLFVTYLINMTTNIRIWNALNPDPEMAKLSVIQNVLSSDSTVGHACTRCLTTDDLSIAGSNTRVSKILDVLGLNDSQRESILSCITMRKCQHQNNSVQLIWGPPGTGKTKTVASLLFLLFNLKCRTLVCAPTNIAIIQVAERLVKLVVKCLKHDTYGLGDIVLFGNGERMRINDRDEMLDVFLQNRAQVLGMCLSPFTGWKHNLDSMIMLLDDPEEQYRLYLRKGGVTDEDSTDDDDDHTSGDTCSSTDENDVEDGDQEEGESDDVNGETKRVKDESFMRKTNRRFWKKVIGDAVKENEKKKNQKDGIERSSADPVNQGTTSTSRRDGSQTSDNLLPFSEFVRKKFYEIGACLMFCIKNLYTHLPTSFISSEVVEDMIVVFDLLKSLEFDRLGVSDPDRRSTTTKLSMKRHECLALLKSLSANFAIPTLKDNQSLEDFCLSNARLVFCTASSSAKMLTERTNPVEMVVVDEAGQLKECESAIPLQIPGVQRVVLIGDDRQLSAMVQSQVSGDALFGRSLFERLSLLEQKKHLLGVQYRMHPSISLFPNKEFYGNQIVNGDNVKEKCYEKRYLQGNMYGSYSFINISKGTENFNKGHSPKNMVEVYVVCQIIDKLYREYMENSGKKVSVGVVSPYKGQVAAIQEKLGRKYTSNQEGDNGFSVSIRSVDGFQGAEEDIIIISTVRCNGKGSVGFLANHNRTNVALTRARYCLWILGSGATLSNSRTVWSRLVSDATKRGCYYNADEDKDLAQAIADALVETGQYKDVLISMDSLQLESARWKVFFNDDFWKSMAVITSTETQKQVVSLLRKLADGWRKPTSVTPIRNSLHGISSELLEQYEVDDSDHLKLVWTVDIQKQQSKYVQVMKVWDVLPQAKIPKLAMVLDELFGNYTINMLNRCKNKSFEGNLVVPMTWPLHSVSSSLSVDSADQCLSGQFASLTL